MTARDGLDTFESNNLNLGEIRMSFQTSLYRHFDVHGNLLYVGISIDAIQRFSEHRREKRWSASIVSMTVEHFETREEAIKAETVAIKLEKPLYNIIHNSNYVHSRKKPATFKSEARAKLIGPLKPLMVSAENEWACNSTGRYIFYYLHEKGLLASVNHLMLSKQISLNKWGSAFHSDGYWLFFFDGSKKYYKDYKELQDSKEGSSVKDRISYEDIKNSGWIHSSGKFGNIEDWKFES